MGSSHRITPGPRALIKDVIPFSPADDAGFEAGCFLTAVDGHPLRDIIDWRWYADGDCVTVDYIDLDGEVGSVELEREPGEDWGFVFDGVVFDEVRLCRNACTFCFVRQLPQQMRPSLSQRDDDFRLSFLGGTFITLTNFTEEDEQRIREQWISPLRVSLHASDPAVRRSLIGPREAHGIEVLERLLDAGIEVHAQIVLVPDVNDGDVLCDTLAWAYEREGICNVGVVPLGFTRYQQTFSASFNDPARALAVLETIRPFRVRAQAERNTPWVFAADEFYRNAYGAEILDHLPPASDYGDYSLFEDGIGIIRSSVDEFTEAQASGLTARLSRALDEARCEVVMVVGYAMEPYVDQLFEASELAGAMRALPVENAFFGGNVDVTGLLCGCDIACAIAADAAYVQTGRASAQSASADDAAHAGSGDASAQSASAADAAHAGSGDASAQSASADDAAQSSKRLYVVPAVIFNDDRVTLDDMTLETMEKEAGVPLHVISCNPLTYLEEILELVASAL